MMIFFGDIIDKYGYVSQNNERSLAKCYAFEFKINKKNSIEDIKISFEWWKCLMCISFWCCALHTHRNSSHLTFCQCACCDDAFLLRPHSLRDALHNNLTIYINTQNGLEQGAPQCGDLLGGEHTFLVVFVSATHRHESCANTRNLIYFRFMRFVYFYWLLLLPFYREFRIAFILTSNTVRSNLHTFCKLLNGINSTRSK